MRLKHIIAIIVTGGLAAAGFALYRYVNKQKKLLEDYNVSLLKIQLSDLSEDLLSVSFTLRIANKSAIEATIQKVYADIYLNGVYVGNVINEGGAVVPATGSGDIKLKFTVASKEILKNVVSALFTLLNTKDVPYRLNGYVNMKSGDLISVSVPFDYSGGIKSDML